MLIKILVALLLITFPFGQVFRLEFFNSQLVLRPNDVIAMILGGWGLLKISGPLKKPLLLWYAAMILSLVINIFNYTPIQLLISASYAIRFILYSGLYFIFKDLKVNRKYLVLVTMLIALVGFGQYWFLPDTRFLKDFGWDDHYYRLISSFLDPGFTGTILLLGLLITKNKLTKTILYIAIP